MGQVTYLKYHRPSVVTLLAVAVPTLVLGFFAAGFRVDSAVDQLLPTDDRDRFYYEGVKEAFGSEEIGVVALFADDVFTPETLERIEKLDRALTKIDGVREVTSLATLDTIRLDDLGLGRQRLMPPLPLDATEKEEFRREALAHPIGHRTVVSADGHATALLLRFDSMSDEDFVRRGIDGKIRAIVAAHPGSEEVAVTGLPTIKVQAARALLEDLGLFVPFGVLVAVLVLAWTFRTAIGVLLPLSTVLIGLVWTTALMVLTGGAYTMGSVVLPPLLVCVGIAYAIHIVSRYNLELTSGGPARKDVVGTTMAHVRVPVIMAAVTTLAGFATFLGNPIPSIRDFGRYSSFGITVVMLAALTAVPAALSLLRTPARGAPPPEPDDWASRAVRRSAVVAIRHRKLILVLGAAIVLASVRGAALIRIETDYLRFFAPTNPVRIDNARVAEALAGTQLILVSIDGSGPESATRLPVVDALRDLEAFVDRQPGVDRSVSLLDHLLLLRRAIEPEIAAEPIDDQLKLDQLLLLLNPEETRRAVNLDQSRAALTVYTRLSGSEEVRDFVDAVDEFAARRFPAGVRVHATGTVVLLNRSAVAVARGQITGLYRMFAILLVLMILLFRSVGLGLLSLVPNLFPVIVLFGLMGAFGIDLNISTSLIGCISIGIAVDDTIHYLTNFNAQRRKGADAETAVRAAVRDVGRPIVVTSIALAAGFLVVCLSNFQPIRHFGALTSAIMIVALLADLFLLPALLLTLVKGRARSTEASGP